MIFKNFSDFQKKVVILPHRVMALDVGTKTVGLAVSDSRCVIASPLKTVFRKGKLNEATEILKVVKDYTIQSVLMGYPLHMHGDEGERCAYVQVYAEQLVEKISLPILLWDERMSTLSAERILLETDMSRTKRKEHIDAIAASVILQSFLDFLHNHLR